MNLASERSIANNLKAENFHYFINAGAYTKVDLAEKDKVNARKINTEALDIIAKKADPNTRVIHISTDYVYHLNIERPLLETDLTKPKGVYAKTKLQGERKLLDTRNDSIILRTSWLYSSFGHNFVKTMLRLGKDRNQLSIVNDQYGSPTYVREVAATLIQMIRFIENDKTLSYGGIYNYSNFGMTTWSDFAQSIFDRAKINCHIVPISTKQFGAPAPRPNWSLLSKEKLQKTFHIKIPHWEDSLAECLEELGI